MVAQMAKWVADEARVCDLNPAKDSMERAQKSQSDMWE